MSKTASQEKKAKKVLIVEDEGDMCLLLNILLNGKEMELDHGFCDGGKSKSRCWCFTNNGFYYAYKKSFCITMATHYG